MRVNVEQPFLKLDTILRYVRVLLPTLTKYLYFITFTNISKQAFFFPPSTFYEFPKTAVALGVRFVHFS